MTMIRAADAIRPRLPESCDSVLRSRWTRRKMCDGLCVRVLTCDPAGLTEIVIIAARYGYTDAEILEINSSQRVF
jgi:hypothetical protein